MRSRGVLEQVEPEGFGIICPGFAAEPVRSQAGQGFEAPGEVVGGQEGIEMRPQLGVGPIVMSFDGGLIQRPVDPFDLAVGSRMVRLNGPVLDTVLLAEQIGHVGAMRRGRT